MIPTKRLSPFAFGYRITSRLPGAHELVLIARATYELAPGKPLTLVRSSLDEFGEDVPEAREALDRAALLVGQGSLCAERLAEPGPTTPDGLVEYPGDFAAWKPRCDVILRGYACALPGASECAVGVGLGRMQKQARVAARTPIDRLPASSAGRPLGFGAIASTDPFRRAKLGTSYGEAYERDRAPWYPVDYDWTAENAAPPDQQLENYPVGDEEISLLNLDPSARTWRVSLPGVRPRAAVMLADETVHSVPYKLDTIFIELTTGRLVLTWRGLVRVVEDDLSDVAFILVADEPLNAPAPAEHYEALLKAFSRDPYGLGENPATQLLELEKKLESGELETSLGSGDSELMKVLGPLLQGAGSAGEAISGGMSRMQTVNPGTNKLTGAALLDGLRTAFDGPSAPRVVITDKGGAELGPTTKRAMRDLAKAERTCPKGGFDREATREGVRRAFEAAGTSLSDDDLVFPENLDLPDPAPGADFSGCDVDDKDYSGVDLTGANFDGAMLRNVNLCGANLRGASLRGAALLRCTLDDTDAQEADLTQAQLTRVSLARARFARATLSQANFTRCKGEYLVLTEARATMLFIERCDFPLLRADRATFEKCAFNTSMFRGSHFDGSTLMKSFFRECTLERASFVQADLSSGGFFDSNLVGAILTRGRGERLTLQCCTLDGAQFGLMKAPGIMILSSPALGADFTAADLSGARFYRAGLRGARFDRANLKQGDFRKAVLTNTSFRGASCYQAAFIEAHGTDADFRGANLYQANFSRSKLVKHT